MYTGLHVKYPLFLSDIHESWIFSTDFRKILISNLMKIRPMGAKLFNADRRTDTHREKTTTLKSLLVNLRTRLIKETTNITVYRHVMTCSFMNRYEHLEKAYYLHFHGRSVPSKSRNLKFINTDIDTDRGKWSFSCPSVEDRLWGAPSLLSTG